MLPWLQKTICFGRWRNKSSCAFWAKGSLRLLSRENSNQPLSEDTKTIWTRGWKRGYGRTHPTPSSCSPPIHPLCWFQLLTHWHHSSQNVSFWYFDESQMYSNKKAVNAALLSRYMLGLVGRRDGKVSSDVMWIKCSPCRLTSIYHGGIMLESRDDRFRVSKTVRVSANGVWLHRWCGRSHCETSAPRPCLAVRQRHSMAESQWHRIMQTVSYHLCFDTIAMPQTYLYGQDSFQFLSSATVVMWLQYICSTVCIVMLCKDCKVTRWCNGCVETNPENAFFFWGHHRQNGPTQGQKEVTRVSLMTFLSAMVCVISSDCYKMVSSLWRPTHLKAELSGGS